jgi:hypothetical protein
LVSVGRWRGWTGRGKLDPGVTENGAPSVLIRRRLALAVPES